MSMTETQAAPESNIAEKTNRMLAGEKGILLFVALFVALVAVITATFGLPGLAMSALTMVPIVYAILILITVGK